MSGWPNANIITIIIILFYVGTLGERDDDRGGRSWSGPSENNIVRDSVVCNCGPYYYLSKIINAFFFTYSKLFYFILLSE